MDQVSESGRTISADPVELKVSVSDEPIRLLLFEDDYVSNLIRRDLCWEMTETRLLAAQIKKNHTVLDIGANLGYYTVLAAKLAPEGIVHAFEPDKENFELLRQNCALNGCNNVILHNVALSARRGRASFFRSARNAGDHRLAALGDLTAGDDVTLEIGDALLADLPRVDLIKCDTQGSEAVVFAGLAKLLARSTPRPVCFVEFEPLGLAAMGGSAAELLDRFDRLGYAYSFVNCENLFSIDRNTLLQLASYWVASRTQGNLDLVLTPS